MKNLLYILLFFFSACKQDKATIERLYLVNLTLDFCLESLRDDAENTIESLKKKVASEGNTAEGLQLINRADLIKTRSIKLIEKIEKTKNNLMQKKRYKIYEKPNIANSFDVIIYQSDLENLEKDLGNFTQLVGSKYKDLKKIANELKNTKEDFLSISHCYNQPLAAVLPLLTQKQIQIISLEKGIFEALTVKDETPKYSLLGFVSVESDIVPLGENYKAHISFVKCLNEDIVEMTCNNVPIPVDKNGVGKARFKAKNLGLQTWKGTIKIKKNSRDSTFSFVKIYNVMPKMK